MVITFNTAKNLLLIQTLSLAMAVLYTGTICIAAKFPGIEWVLISLIMGMLVIIFEKIVLNAWKSLKIRPVLVQNSNKKKSRLTQAWWINLLLNLIFFFKFSFPNKTAMIWFIVGMTAFIVLSGFTTVFRKRQSIKI